MVRSFKIPTINDGRGTSTNIGCLSRFFITMSVHRSVQRWVRVVVDSNRNLSGFSAVGCKDSDVWQFSRELLVYVNDGG